MKKYIQSLMISVSASDGIRIFLLIFLNLICLFTSPIILYFLAYLITNDNFYVAAIIITCILTILSALLVRTFKIWVISLPTQFVVFFLVLWLILGGPVGMSIQFIVFIFIPQAIGVAIGLLIRKHRARKRKQAHPAE